MGRPLSVAVDVNRIRESAESSPGQILHGQNDWSAIGYGLIGGLNYGDFVHLPADDDELNTDLFEYLNSIPPPCPADLDGTDTVGAADLAIVLGAWGPNPGHPADLDGDDVVGAADLAQVLGAWGPCLE